MNASVAQASTTVATLVNTLSAGKANERAAKAGRLPLSNSHLRPL
jgi:hypothetical protein